MSATSEHYVIAENEAEAIWFLGTLATVKAAATQTGGALSIVEFTHPPGFAVPPHIHHTTDEGFYVLEGAMRGSCGDQTWHAESGSFVWLPRGIPTATPSTERRRFGPWRSPCPPASSASWRRWGSRRRSAPCPRLESRT